MKWALPAVAAIAVLVAVAVGGLYLLRKALDTCGDTIVSELPSPDGALKAVLFERNCGATTGFSSQVSILDPDESVTEAGNVFAADTDHGNASEGAWGGPDVRLTWTGARQLTLHFVRFSRVLLREEHAGDVTIRFVDDL